MFEFHKDKATYFDIQYQTSKEHIIPYLERHIGNVDGKHVLEIGCGEAGVLKGFLEKNCSCVGIELSESRVALAEQFFAEHPAKDQLTLISKNIYDITVDDISHKQFDIIVLKDVIEHIPDQQRFFHEVRKFLHDSGVMFFGFPPWQMPFGGHQQIAKSKFLSKALYVHLLPRALYQKVIQWSGENDGTRKELMEIFDTGISIERFERCLKQASFKISNRFLWLTNPIYSYKFGLKVRPQFSFIAGIPVIRNFVSTCAYYIIKKQHKT